VLSDGHTKDGTMILSQSRLNVRYSCLWLSLLIVAVCLIVSGILLRRDSELTRQDPQDVVRRFVYGLQSNDLKGARFLVTTEKRLEFETWIRQHEKVTCPTSLDTLGEGSYYLQTTDDGDKRKTYLYMEEYPCAKNSGRYWFSVRDIVVELREGGWIVVDWGEIEETLPGE
jgi:hypothetical protein